MATENKQTWGSRSKKTSVIALGLVAILAGIAVAYFLTSAKFANNRAVGGTLTVDATLPMDFSDEPLYPVNAEADGFAEKEFSITNNNAVNVTYQLFATCEECIPDPADTPEQADARAAKADQFNNLMVKITTGSETCAAGAQSGTPILCTNGSSTKYNGKLADLTPTNPADLGNINDGDEVTYTVRLWLKNDASREQPQNVENLWEFFVNAKTPA